ncbi:glycosyltransferase family 4 protein [Actinomadura sp. SCN-SB]|uniref:glycosyltransferase family 4 protein n=1 Tax=Actinomadura sp. SCN-SB TaxID=3373092 RepID=UPI0037506420
MNIAFVLLTYAADAPAGVERTLAALTGGLRRLGHQAVILTAVGDEHADSQVIRLRSIHLPSPAREEHLGAALAQPAPIAHEVRRVLTERNTDVVCWADAAWGLGHLAPAPPGVRTALKVSVLRTDPLFHQALAHEPDAVITNSPFLRKQASMAGIDATRWIPVPNALLTTTQPPEPDQREELRRSGPIRIVARAEPHKGIRELITALPPGLNRRVEVVLAEAGFEYWPGMQDTVLAECTEAARQAPGQVTILPALPWRQVPDFLGGAALTIISTTSPETWCNVAAEALSAGTPVIAYAFGHVPVLTGAAGVMIPPGAPATALWEAATDLLGDTAAYHLAARTAPTRVADHTPTASASHFLAAVTA